MGDFLLDFRDPETRRRSALQAASLLRFCDDTEARFVERDAWSLVLARVDGFDLWGPCERSSPAGNIFVALAGRIALDEPEWEAAEKIEAAGGLACKAILGKYRCEGIAGLGTLNGNFVAFVHDETKNEFYVVTDRCGMFLGYRQGTSANSLIFGSHPDVLADVSGESQNWNMASLAEFLMTSRLSFPYTYYRNIRALDPGCVFTIGLRDRGVVHQSQSRYFQFDFNPDPKTTEDDLAQELASAFRRAVRRRTHPRFGCTGIGLSGGLDSRAMLSAADPRSETRAFTLFDEENAEFKVAKAIAKACHVEMLPLKRDFEYYGDSAKLGVRISGGTGCITCNHFLGVRERLKEAGITNLLTGCYCDYLFKGLAFNRREQWLARTDELNGFSFEFYDPFHWLKTPARQEVMARLNAEFPEATMGTLSERDWLEVERKRTFPLAYEQDLAQRVIPQRMMPWYVPLVDNDIIDTYLKMPPESKLNGRVFRKMLTSICPESVRAIPDSNTNAAIGASWPGYALYRSWSALRNRLEETVTSRMATRGSWPNWRHYLRHSKTIESLWNQPNETAAEVFTTILGRNPFELSVREHAAQDLVLFQRLFTQKLWLDQRVS
jgi:asparagine synthase (glutamine-hydrolysing)